MTIHIPKFIVYFFDASVAITLLFIIAIVINYYGMSKGWWGKDTPLM